MTMIVEDTIAIGQRLREIEQEARQNAGLGLPAEFKIPDDLLIIRAINVTPPLRFSPDYEIVFLLHETIRPPKLTIAHIRNPESARQKLGAFIRLLERYYPSVNVVKGEVAFSVDDCERLLSYLRKS